MLDYLGHAGDWQFMLSRALDWRVVAVQLGVILTSYYLWDYVTSPIRDIPGPVLARWTRFWHIRRIFAGDQNLELLRLHAEHGHFVRIAPDEVSVSHPDGVRKLFLASIPKGWWYAGLAVPDWRYMAPMTITDPKAKIELSKLLGTGFSLTSILQAEDSVTHIFEQFLDWVDQYADSKERMELDKFITFATVDVVGEVIFSKPFGFTQGGKDIGGSAANIKLLSLMTAVTPFFRKTRQLFITNPFMTWLNILPFGHVYDTSVSSIDARKDNPDARFDILAHWLRALRENPDRLTMRNVLAQASNSVAAGGETVSCAVAAFIFYLIRHPKALARVRQEVAEAQAEGRCQTRVVTYADAQKLPYLQATIKESLRFFTPVPMGLPRAAPKGGLTIGDRFFPEGTVLSINPWVVHRSPELWGPDAGEFNPDRWFREGASAREKKFYVPFGAGYGSCPGHHIAKMEISKMTATLTRDFDFRLVNPDRDWTWKAYFSVMPYDWPVYVEKRKAGSGSDSGVAVD